MDNCPMGGIDLTVDPPGYRQEPCENCEWCARICPTGALDIIDWRDVPTAMQAYLLQVGIQAELDIPELPKFFFYLMSGWHNTALFSPFVPNAANFNKAFDNFAPTSPFMKSWLRTPEWIEAYNAAFASPISDREVLHLSGILKIPG
jgi:ferredoxin